jgi:hypothetical protein
MWGRIVALVCLTGCDLLFQLEHIEPTDANGSGSGSDSGPACGPASGAATTTLLGARSGAMMIDTFVSDDIAHLSQNFGSADTLFACTQCSCTSGCESVSGGDDDVRALLRFDLEGAIPRCSRVMTAALVIDTTDDNLGNGSVLVYAVGEAWTEGTGPAAGSLGAASWTDRVAGMPWLDPGVGPDSRSANQVGIFAPAGTNQAYQVNIDHGTVQAWVDDPTTNHGVVLLVSGSTSDVHFHSSEATDPARRPGLIVMYTPP